MFEFLVSLVLHLSLARSGTAPSWWDMVPPARSASLPLAAAQRRPEIPKGPVKKDADRLGIDTTARGAVVVDWGTGLPLFEKNADEAMSIASISKLMTAIVVIEAKPKWDAHVDVLGDDMRAGNIAYVSPGETVTVRDLFGLSLVASSNEATVALARSTGMTPEEFAAKMNDTARKIGMANAHFAEPTGLSELNQASARDVALLIRTAFANPEIRDMAERTEYSFTALTGRAHRAFATDQLLGSFLSRDPYTLLGGKTGFTNEAGYCFGAAAENGDGDRVIAVVLGTDSKQRRFDEVKALAYWAFDAYRWPDGTTQQR